MLEGDNFLAKRQPFCGVVPEKKNVIHIGRFRLGVLQTDSWEEAKKFKHIRADRKIWL